MNSILLRPRRKDELSNWTRLVLFFIFWLFASALFYLPIIILYPDFMEGSRTDFENLYSSNPFFLFLSQAGLLAGVFVAIYLMAVQIEKRKMGDVGLTFSAIYLVRGFILGAFIMTVFALLALSLHLVEFSFSRISYSVPFGLLIYLLVSVGEEVIVRGYVITNMREKLSTWYAVLFSSLLFGVLHIFNNNFSWIGFTNISLSGVLMGIVVIKSKSISASVGLHWSWNFIQGTIVGFNVSGHFEKGVFDVNPLASSMLTGGDFGAEGSILLIPITIVAIYFVWRSNFFRVE